MQVLKDEDDGRHRREPGDQGTNGGERLPLLFLRAGLAAGLAVTVTRARGAGGAGGAGGAAGWGRPIS